MSAVIYLVKRELSILVLCQPIMLGENRKDENSLLNTGKEPTHSFGEALDPF